jgi:hypothetical protein
MVNYQVKQKVLPAEGGVFGLGLGFAFKFRGQ